MGKHLPFETLTDSMARTSLDTDRVSNAHTSEKMVHLATLKEVQALRHQHSSLIEGAQS